MNEGAVFLAVVVIAVLSYRYFAGPADGPGGSTRTDPRQGSSRGRQVTPAMVEVIQAMFPHLPPSSIAYDLSRTGSVEITTNNILSRNTLPPAPQDSPYHQLFPSPQAPQASSHSSPIVSTPNLIAKYQLSGRLAEEVPLEAVPPQDTKGKGKAPSQWSQSQSEREATFRRRRDDMILKARRKLEAEKAAK